MNFFQTSNGFYIHYRWIDAGKSRTFLFINSLGTDFRIWDAVVETLKPEGNILLFDKRGHGLSDINPNTLGLTDYMQDTLELLEHLSIRKCVPVGLSIGGMIAQLLAFHHPDLIEKLILCDTRSRIGDESFWNNRIRQVMQTGLKELSDGILHRWFPETFHRKHPEYIAGCRNMLEQCSVDGYLQACAAIRDADLTETTRQIKAPVLCVAGSEDLSTPAEEVKTLSALIPGARFKEIKGSGHIPCIDNPGVLCKLIIEFINA